MTAAYSILTLIFVLCSYNLLVIGRDLTLEPGHLKPFGFGSNEPVEEVSGFPEPEDFFRTYVWPIKPLKMKGAAKISPAFKKWADEYFLSQDYSGVEKVTVETMKKESRQQQVTELTFPDFVRIYNNSEYYMVNSVPGVLRQDVVMPCPIQCSDVVSNNLIEDVMWFSSGGTKSVVHTDNVDNINCLFRGEKQLFFVDPSKYGDKVDLDRPEGAYSTMDVDSVDFTKFPGMADVEYYHVNLSAGDCLYIPYKWIHQVRSYGSNIAVNIWWKHHMSDYLNFDKCNKPCDLEFTLSEANFGGFEQLTEEPEEIRGYLQGIFGKKKTINLPQLMVPLLGSEYRRLMKSSRKDDLLGLAQEVFIMLDANDDSLVSKEEVDKAELSVFMQISDKLKVLETVLEHMYDEINIDDDDEGEEIIGDRDETDPDDLVEKKRDEL